MYGLILAVGLFLGTLWLLAAIGQRRNRTLARVRVPQPLAMLAGSRTNCVIWRSFVIQAGLMFWFVLYAGVMVAVGRASFGACGVVTLVLMVIWQRFPPKEACGE